MSSIRIVAPAVLAVVVALTAACGVSQPSDPASKDIVLKEVTARGFTSPALAPDSGNGYDVYVYAGYRGCRLLLHSFKGNIKYGDLDDVSPARLDAIAAFDPCRKAASGASPTA